MKRIDKIIEYFPKEDFLKADGFDKALIGVCLESKRLVYSSKKCIDILIKNGMDLDEAIEYFDYNVVGSYMGEKTPIWCEDSMF